MPAKPLTLLSPVPWWWSIWIRLSWPPARCLGVANKLRKLSFIHFARWSLIGRWPRPGGMARDRAAERSLLFLTTFDGSDLQYIETFVRVVPERIAGLYWGASGFPSPWRFGPVDRYIDDHEQEVDHFWIAYPDATTTMVNQALRLRAADRDFAARVHGADPARFRAEWRRFLAEVQDLL
jgi:hypothetical protein